MKLFAELSALPTGCMGSVYVTSTKHKVVVFRKFEFLGKSSSAS